VYYIYIYTRMYVCVCDDRIGVLEYIPKSDLEKMVYKLGKNITHKPTEVDAKLMKIEREKDRERERERQKEEDKKMCEQWRRASEKCEGKCFACQNVSALTDENAKIRLLELHATHTYIRMEREKRMKGKSLAELMR